MYELKSHIKFHFRAGGVVPQLRWLVAGFPSVQPNPRLGPAGSAGQKVALGWGFSEHFQIPTKFSSTNCFTFINHPVKKTRIYTSTSPYVFMV
jgi:hypothetical protein